MLVYFVEKHSSRYELKCLQLDTELANAPSLSLAITCLRHHDPPSGLFFIYSFFS